MLRFSISAIATFLIAGFVAAQVPSVMNYQGRLTDNTPSQDPITDILPIEFRIYGSAMGQDLVWSESWGAVDVVDGIFSVLLGSNGAPIPTTVFTGVAGTGTDRYQRG